MQATIWHHMILKRKQKGFKSQIRKSEKGKLTQVLVLTFGRAGAGNQTQASPPKLPASWWPNQLFPLRCTVIYSTFSPAPKLTKIWTPKLGGTSCGFCLSKKKVGNSNLLAGGNVVGWVVQTPASRLTPLLTLYF